jgi:hypothetical protein
MKRCHFAACILSLATFAVLLPQLAFAQEPFKWYGIGGEITGESGEPRRWLGRLGIGEQLGVEALFAMEHISSTGIHEDNGFTRLDVGAGIIYDVAPAAAVTPYLAGRFILVMTGNGEDNTSGVVETACGVEYVIMKRLGISGELNFSFHTDPTQIFTSTRVRCYFYL